MPNRENYGCHRESDIARGVGWTAAYKDNRDDSCVFFRNMYNYFFAPPPFVKWGYNSEETISADIDISKIAYCYLLNNMLLYPEQHIAIS